MDRYQGNLDRYQEEIRRAAAKGVKDLNLNGNPTISNSTSGRSLPKTVSSSSITSTNGNVPARTKSPIVTSPSTSVQSSISVSAAAARFESLQRLNQINISNANGGRVSATTVLQNDNVPKDGSGRRRSTGPILATMLPTTREQQGSSYSNRFISKSNSASSVLQQTANGNQVIRSIVQPTKSSISSISGTSCGGVIADFAFGNGDIAQNISNNTTSHVYNRVSPLTLNNNETNDVDLNPLPQVQQLTARFNQVLNTNPNQCQILNNANSNNSTQSSRQSSISPFPSRVSPSPNAAQLKTAPSGLPLTGFSTDQTNMVLTNQRNLSNGISLPNHKIWEPTNIKVCNI